jgi:photosynthetic reaction center H subunit
MTEGHPRVAPLAQLENFEVADGDPDVRGWDVISADGRKIGKVNGLLVDTAAMRVRYLDVHVDEELRRETAGERHILVPVGYARLNEAGDRVRLDELTSLQLDDLPAYDGAPLTAAYETAVLRAFDADCSRQGVEEEGRGRAYDAERFYGGTRRGTGTR